MAERQRIDVLEERIASRKDFGAYLDVKAEIRRADMERTDEFIAGIHARLAQVGRESERRAVDGPDA